MSDPEIFPHGEPPAAAQPLDRVVNELRRRMAADKDDPLFKVGVMAMTAQSDPYATAAVYRQALIDICSFALEAQESKRLLAVAPAAALSPTTDKVATAMWAAIDVVKASVGPFNLWPDALKEAFSNAMIADDQTLTPREIEIGQAIAKRRGFLIDEAPVTKDLDPDDFETLARLINECLGRRKHRKARNRLVELRERVVAHKLTHSIERHTEYYDVVDGQFRLSRVRCRDCSYDIEIKPLSPPPPPCPNEGCACDISTRHEWFIAFCEEREKLKHSPQPPTPDHICCTSPQWEATWRCASCGAPAPWKFNVELGSPQPPSERLPQALALMNIRDWVDEGIAIQEREYGHVSVPGLASNVAAQVWLHVQNALSAETPTVCLCGHSRAAHTYYRTGGIFTACKACKCDAYEPGVASPRSPWEK